MLYRYIQIQYLLGYMYAAVCMILDTFYVCI